MGFVATVRHLAETTSPQRNRVVDLFRAGSIAVVVLGHWTLAAVTVRDGRLVAGQVLSLDETTHPFTWAFQVMPVFFLVGGYANGRSWRSARGRGGTYGGWLRARCRRLLLPLVPVLLFWLAASWLALRQGVDWRTVRLASSVALVPTWFLAAYILVTALAPAGLWLWERWRFATIVAGGLLAGAVDVLSLTTGSIAVGAVNYLVVWATVHQLGFAWLDGYLDGARRRLLLCVSGLVGAVGLVALGPYPVSMVAVDAAAVNNSDPTRITMLFLGMFQAGLLLLLEDPCARAMRHARLWTFVVAVNARIMTIYLWHVTAMVAVVALAVTAGGVGLHVAPLSAGWWLTRPLWYLVLAVMTAVFVAILGRFETPAAETRPVPPWWRPMIAVVTVCAGRAALAVLGAVDAGGVHLWLFLVPVLGVYVGGVARLPQRRRRPVTG